MKRMVKSVVIIILVLSVSTIYGTNVLYAQKSINLTFESAVDIAMENSYRISQLEMGIERTRYWLEARRASLKSRVSMNLQAPDLNSTSEFKWNSEKQKDELVRQNTRRWQMDLSIRQPVILFGYPTNGYLSLNNKIYRYLQKQDGSKDVNYYNRYFVRFEQPLFQPNRLKNDIERAELDLENSELDFINNLVRMIDDIGDDYYELFELSYRNIIHTHHVANLEKVSKIASRISQQDTNRSIDVIQVQVALSNTQEKLLENQSDMRLESARMIQRLRLDLQDSLRVEPVVKVTPITVDLDQAIQYGFTLRPSMQQLAIRKRRDEINLENTKGRNSFRINLEMTYGLEKQDEQYDELWYNHDTSYSASVNAYVPIWDWGEQKAYEEADKVRIQQTELSIEERENEIKSEIINTVGNLEEYQRRALNMKENMGVSMELTDLSIAQFDENRISIQDILQIIERQEETELNFLDAYLGYRESLLRLLVNTHYDYEKDISLREQFRAQHYNETNSTNRIAQNSHHQDIGPGSNLTTGEIKNTSLHE